MSSHVYSDIYLHATWHCAHDRPLLTEEIGEAAHGHIREYCAKEKGVHFLGIGGTSTHVHLAFQMEPFVNLSEFLGKVKGAASHEMNLVFGKGTLHWQRGYGVVSFSRRQKRFVLEYVKNQKQHHATGDVVPGLEVELGDESIGETGRGSLPDGE